MKLKIIVLVLAIAIIVMPSMSNAYVNAKYWIKDDAGNLIYMMDDKGKIIYGNVLVGQDVIFDGSQSSSFYKGVDKYYWDFDGDGRYDKILSSPTVHHTYNKAGIYYAKLLAVDTSGPSGAADAYVKEIRVVEKYAAPVANFRIKMVGNTSSEKTFIFNASSSYDPDGYIKYYRWDFDGDGEYEKEIYRKSNASLSFDKSGYYVITLQVEDWDGMKSKTSRVLKVDGIQGENVEQVKKNITIVNDGESQVNVTLTVNNCDTFHFKVTDKRNVAVELNPHGLNEICVNLSDSSEKYALFHSNSKVEVHLLADGGIEIKTISKGIPGFGAAAVLLSLILVFYKRKSLKI